MAVGEDGQTLVPHAGEQATIAAVRALRRNGLSLRAVVDALARHGYTGRTGRPLQLTQVARILGA
jgi:hypothetical protein